MERSCWGCKYLVDWTGIILFETSNVGGSRFTRNNYPTVAAKEDPDEGCKHFENRKTAGRGNDIPAKWKVVQHEALSRLLMDGGIFTNGEFLRWWGGGSQGRVKRGDQDEIILGMSQDELIKSGKGLPDQRFQKRYPIVSFQGLRRESSYRLHIHL